MASVSVHTEDDAPPVGPITRASHRAGGNCGSGDGAVGWHLPL
jgi:hypothetical protein